MRWLDYRVVEEATGESAMAGNLSADNGGVERTSGTGKMDRAEAWRLALTDHAAALNAVESEYAAHEAVLGGIN
jgi:hypothetical protein